MPPNFDRRLNGAIERRFGEYVTLRKRRYVIGDLKVTVKGDYHEKAQQVDPGTEAHVSSTVAMVYIRASILPVGWIVEDGDVITVSDRDHKVVDPTTDDSGLIGIQIQEIA